METKFKPGEAIVRFRGNMKADNAVNERSSTIQNNRGKTLHIR